MVMWLGLIIGILAGLLLGALSTLWINYKTEKEVSNEMVMVLLEAVVQAKNEIHLRKYGLSQIECNEVHLPGDCPLCGAD